MFNRARPDKETEGIIGRKRREQTERQREKEQKEKQESGLAEAKQYPPLPPPAAKPFKTAPGPRCN